MKSQAGFVPHVTTLGRGARRALALHCTLAFGGAWAGVAKALDREMTLIAPDMPSHGKSADWDETSDFADTVYAAALASLDTAPMDVIGHSFGAVTALRLALSCPERVRSLTMIEPVFFAVAYSDAPALMHDQDVRDAPFRDAMSNGDHPLAARLFNRGWGDGPPWDSMPEKSRLAMIRAIAALPDIADFIYKDAAGMLGRDILDTVTMPTLLIRGTASPPVVAAIANGLVARLPNATQIAINGAGHMAPISHPVPVADAIKAVLDRS